MKPFNVQLVGNDYNQIMIVDDKNGGLIPPDPEKHNICVSVTQKKNPDGKQNEQYKQNKLAKTNERFIFARMESEERFCHDLDFATLWRLAVLATYSSFAKDDNDGFLTNGMLTKAQKPMTKKEMQVVLRLQKRTFDRFLGKVCHVDNNGEVRADLIDPDKPIVNYLYPSNDGKWMLNSDYFLRGTLTRGEESFVNRLYIDTIRKLHSVSKQKDHAALGMILALMPFVNRRWNVICSNPFETDAESILPLTPQQMCMVLGLNSSHAERTIGRIENDNTVYGNLYKQLIDIELMIDGKLQVFCNITGNKYGAYLVVNPNFVYLGNEKDKRSIIESNLGFTNRFKKNKIKKVSPSVSQ